MNLTPYMVLSRFFLSKLRAKSIADLSSWQAVEDLPPPGDQTTFFNKCLETASADLAPLLPDLDRRIRSYEERLAERRREFAGFKYFQYLTVLASEYHFFRLTSDPEQYLHELNEFLRDRAEAGELEPGLTPFEPSNLRRLAFYLATGSGKTILLHVHYWQIRHYLQHGSCPEALAPKGFDNILLLTPNQGLAQQHLSELAQSGIPATHLTEVKHNPSSVSPGTVLVVDIPKLRNSRAKDETEAEGIYYPMLGRTNLVFVDEGHKGTRNADSAWRRIREFLSEQGLLLEYSATFAQVLSTPEHCREYGKRILADYQYRYFYRDGYGKDFDPINVEASELPNAHHEDAAMTGALLLYYRQLSQYIREAQELAKYNIEKPLWVFVGHTVTKTATGKLGVVEEDAPTLTDVARVIRFLKRFVEEPEWAQEMIRRAIHATDFIGTTNPFARHLIPFQGRDPAELYREIQQTVFGGEGALELHLLPAKGEIGLKLSAARDGRYFGVIKIGDVQTFKGLLEREQNLSVGENPFQESLFDMIKAPDSPIHLLIGARMFSEGWSSFRVSTMTLLHVGQGEGPQIIQLFGRGVRLLGQNRSLKRCGRPRLKALETLYIVGLKADYVGEFLRAIAKEELHESFELPLEHNEDAMGKGLPVPRLPDGFDFTECTLSLTADPAYTPTVSLAPKVTVTDRENHEARPYTLEGGSPKQFTPTELQVLDWPRVTSKLRSHARIAGYHNLNFSGDTLRQILECGHYTLTVHAEDIQNARALEAAALTILRRYIDRFYRTEVNATLTRNMTPGVIHPQELPKSYTVSAPKDSEVLSQLKAWLEDLRQWYTSAPSPLPRLYLDPSLSALVTLLYQPLVYETGSAKIPPEVQVSPAPLNEGEYRFITALMEFWRNHHAEHPEVRLYLMRNFSRTGRGFYHRTGFYPDFILWVQRPSNWRVVFVEPHGMHNEDIDDNPRLEVFTDLLPRLNASEEFRKAGIQLDGYILTDTSPEQIRGTKRYAPHWDRLATEKHLLFGITSPHNIVRIIALQKHSY